jgi:tryptophan halogenase
MIKTILVLGGGSAGFIAAISLKTRIPSMDITVVRSKEIGIIGVGEGSPLAFPPYLHGYCKLDHLDFLKKAKPVWKLGLRFLNWGPRPFFDYTFAPALNATWNEFSKPVGYFVDEDFSYANQSSALCSANKVFAKTNQGQPIINRDFGYHVENVPFVAYLESHALTIGVKIAEDTVESVEQQDAGVTSLKLRSGQSMSADLFVDASGFVSLLLGKTLAEPFNSYKATLFCDRAVVGGWERTNEPIKPYTTCEGMDSGWCWQIEHENRINRGYVYSSAFISDENAEREFRAKTPKVGDTRIVKFISGRYERCWVKNVVAIGNSTGFVEPLEATSLGAICDESFMLAETIADADFAPGPQMMRKYNERCGQKWDNIRDFLAMHYRFNTHATTSFWRECQEKVDLCGAVDFVEYFKENGPSLVYRTGLVNELHQFQMEGLLAILVGLKVPYPRKYVPSENDRNLWNEIRGHLKQQGEAGYSVEEAIAALSSGQWRLIPDFFTRGGMRT